MKFKVFKFNKVTSTNDVAINLIKKKRKKFGFVYANLQTKGRGTYGKKWISEKGNLFGTIFFNLKKNYPTISEFTLINPIIIADIIEKFCKNGTISFKKPNDIFVNKKKICGILQEVITLKNKNFLIIGIGINVLTNPTDKLKYKATNLFYESQKKHSILKLIKLIILSYENFFYNLNEYKFINFKRRAKSIALN